MPETQVLASSHENLTDDLMAHGIHDIDGPRMERYSARGEDIANQLLVVGEPAVEPALTD